jgi:peroxiredoxin
MRFPGRSPRIHPIGVVLCLALLLAAAASAAALELVQWPKPQVGDELPDAVLKDTAGKEVRLSDYRGKVIVLTFWSCYADSCFTSVPVLVQLAERHPAGLALPSVCIETPPGLAADNYRGLIERCGRGQPILIDAGKQVKRLLHVLHCPTTFVVGRDFRIREILVDASRLRDPKFERDVEALLREP